MKKVIRAIRYLFAGMAFIAFLLFIDDSGVRFKGHIAKIKEWANK